jgi:F-type H+-transporting ATPase subunit delta
VATETTGLSAVAARYAGALYELAESKGQLDQAARDLASVKIMTEASADLRRLCASPVIGRNQQAKAITAVFDKAGISPLVRNFAGVVAKNGRLFVLSSIASAFLRLLAERRGEATVEVRSAQPLDENQMKALGTALKPMVGDKVAFDVKIDPGILGGLVVKVGSRMFDSSLRTKLQRLQLAMKGIA